MGNMKAMWFYEKRSSRAVLSFYGWCSWIGFRLQAILIMSEHSLPRRMHNALLWTFHESSSCLPWSYEYDTLKSGLNVNKAGFFLKAWARIPSHKYHNLPFEVLCLYMILKTPTSCFLAFGGSMPHECSILNPESLSNYFFNRAKYKLPFQAPYRNFCDNFIYLVFF